MSILMANEIINTLAQELKCADKSIQIVTAYCKLKTIKYLNSNISCSVTDKRIMLRFQLQDIIKGSTDFGVLEYCIVNGWNVFIRFDLHAKTYIVDNKRGIIGSANATNRGLGLGGNGNLEIAVFSDIEEKDLVKIESLYDDAIFVDESIFNELRNNYQNTNLENVSGKTVKWNEKIQALFKPKIKSLFSYELPDEIDIKSENPLGYLTEGNVITEDESRELFRWSNAYLWLLDTLEQNDGCLYFGELSEKLHNALVSDPKPYRKDVKILLANLLKLVDRLNMDEVVIDRPNYSQRVRVKI
ncbi:MAG: hypothetical protein IJ661_00580 [Lachnospiraceae bacterium]|nr:hypothetical protein [Lachnospiraceae bacterium]